MQAGVGHRAASVGFPSRSVIRCGFLLPGRARFFSGKPVNPRLPEAPPPQALLHLCCVDSLAFRVDARVEGTAAAPLRVDSLPQPRTHGRGGFAHLQAVDGEAPRLPRVLRGILLDHEKMVCPDLLKAALLPTMSLLAVPLEASAETCQPPNSFANMPIFIAVALIGAAVGGKTFEPTIVSRRRKEELKRLNNQLRQINTALRRQAQIESFVPGLTYAPVGRTTETDVVVDPRKQQLGTNLRNGKNYMRNQDLDKAVVEFRTALELAESIGDRFEEKKAARGLGASLQRQGKHREAMRQYAKVLELSRETGEDSGCTEAYGAIADCYTELGDLERAAKVYDKYISRLQPGE
ncbi:hypothetical protein C2845_PM12G18750 [Panicum miliaceum]|uniref:Uncharacterized protein n=1 Tax=Panicum miliaceum TaxID=4540 RepID=A0A3L6QE77_PANMI|nr:hypothetical protein C2845_PM12G18750 [Panicum miliaceum]